MSQVHENKKVRGRMEQTGTHAAGDKLGPIEPGVACLAHCAMDVRRRVEKDGRVRRAGSRKVEESESDDELKEGRVGLQHAEKTHRSNNTQRHLRYKHDQRDKK